MRPIMTRSRGRCSRANQVLIVGWTKQANQPNTNFFLIQKQQTATTNHATAETRSKVSDTHAGLWGSGVLRIPAEATAGQRNGTRLVSVIHSFLFPYRYVVRRLCCWFRRFLCNDVYGISYCRYPVLHGCFSHATTLC